MNRLMKIRLDRNLFGLECRACHVCQSGIDNRSLIERGFHEYLMKNSKTDLGDSIVHRIDQRHVLTMEKESHHDNRTLDEERAKRLKKRRNVQHHHRILKNEEKRREREEHARVDLFIGR